MKIIMLSTLRWLMSDKKLSDVFNKDNNIETSEFETKVTESGINYLKQIS